MTSPQFAASRAAYLLFGLLAFFSGCGDDVTAPAEPVIVTVPDGGTPSCGDGACPDAGTRSVCGDGVLDVSLETCDDGNVTDGDGCSATCQKEACGNGKIEAAEQCEPPGTATCTANCLTVISTCGDGATQTEKGEECDDANDTPGDGCHECRKECGDGMLNREIGEECEPAFTPRDPNGVSTTCTDTCKRKPFCGDGRLNAELGEQCDPVNGLTCVDNCRLAQRTTPDAGDLCVPSGGGDGGVQDEVENLAPNGAFTTSLEGWNVPSAVVAKHDASRGVAAPGAAEVTYSPTGSAQLRVEGIQRCVAVEAGRFYMFSAQFFNPSSGQSTGAAAFPVVLLYPNATCSGRSVPTAPGSGAGRPEKDTWLPYTQAIDTGNAATAGTTVSISIKLGVIVSGGQTATAYWDDVALAEVEPEAIDPKCGNCIVDPGETCDDGNHRRRDGCSPRCLVEKDCGNRRVEPDEQCDEGAAKFSDPGMCTPLCVNKSACDVCSLTQCRPEVDACLGLDGIATQGRGKGQPRALLCEKLRKCVLDSGCDGVTAISARTTLAGMPGVFMENCYCGTSGAGCVLSGQANGSCREEVEAALEASDATTILQRMGGSEAAYPIFASLKELRLCEKMSCGAQCTAALSCGNGKLEERSAVWANSFQLTVDGKQSLCADGLTPTGAGCSLEECDGSMMCDDNCFLLQCGNGIVQRGEGCDDGNRASGDGCDADCKPEFECGDSVVDTKFGEQCDPPREGPVCSMADYASNPMSCGCGSTCQYKVCGNGIVQEGEQCDPPNGVTCGDDCKLQGLGECIGCIVLVKESECGTPAFMFGVPGQPGLDPGCFNDEACLKLLKCETDTHCALGWGQVACYCGGSNADTLPECEKPDFVPTGPCQAEIRAAYQSQWAMTPTNAEVVSRYFDLGGAEGRPFSMTNANILTDCVTIGNGFAADLRASGESDETVARCVAACKPQ